MNGTVFGMRDFEEIVLLKFTIRHNRMKYQMLWMFLQRVAMCQ